MAGSSVTGTPLDLDALAGESGIEVVKVGVRGSSIDGKFVRRSGRSFVLINSERPRLRQRLTLAHEIGHHFLAAETDVEYTDEASARTFDAEERSAFDFASELLMPIDWLHANLREGMTADEGIALVARACEVSIDAAAVRLSEMSILPGPWVSAFLEELRGNGARQAFKRLHDLPFDRPSDRTVRLPPSFLERAARLRSAGVLSDERHRELLVRPMP